MAAIVDMWKNFPDGPADWDIWNNFLDAEDLTPLTVTLISSGTNALQADGTKDGGWTVLSCADDTATSGAQIQNDTSFIDLNVNKTYKFLCRIEMTQDADALAGNGVALESEWVIGLLLTDTSILASFPADGIYFRKDEDSATLDLHVDNGGTDVEKAAAATMVVDTKYVLAMKIVMHEATALEGTVTFYLDGAEIGSIHSTVIPSDAAGLCMSIAFESSDAATDGIKRLEMDYWGFTGVY